MSMFKSLLSASVVASLVAGCVAKQDAPPEEIARAIPKADQVQIKLPSTATREAPNVGDLATYYVVTRGVTTTFNGGSAWVLILIHTIVQFPVTSVSGN